MKRRLFVLGMIQIVLVALFLSIPLPAEEIVPSIWTATPLQIDGQIEDWTGAALTSEKGVGVDYAFRNDGRELYVLLIFKNPKSLSSIDMTGLTLYASTSGKKDKDWGVRFIRKTVSGVAAHRVHGKNGSAPDGREESGDPGQAAACPFHGHGGQQEGRRDLPLRPGPEFRPARLQDRQTGRYRPL